jgi:hypothetical protein
MTKKNIYIVILSILIIISCQYKKPVPVSETQIFDLLLYSQEPLYYAQKFYPDSLLISDYRLTEFHSDFRRKFFRPWTDTLHVDSPHTINTLTYYQNLNIRYTRAPGIGENKLRRDSLFAIELSKLTNIDNGFNSMKKGIMLNYSNIRVMPSIKPYFLNFALAGEGYPFDYWQNSTIPIGTPIFIFHETENWALIESHICSGWIPRNHFVYVYDSTIDIIMNSPQVAITKDKTPILNKYSSYIGHADIGTVFSIKSEQEGFYEGIFVSRNEFHFGETISIIIPKRHSAMIPIPLTTYNIARLATQMMNQVYGWGGMYFNRDCSQSLLDLYIGFGILLPRNGRAQAYNFGRFYDMRGITDISTRKREIIENAIPFLTLVRTPGHIMLYVGHENGEPLVFHTIWGLRTIEKNKQDGRHIIGRTVITSMEPGKELRNINPRMTLINRLEGITFFIDE